MPVPNTITDLSTVASANSPAGSDQVLPQLDDYLRAHAAFIRQTHDTAAAAKTTADAANAGLAGKFDKTGGTLTGGLTATAVTTPVLTVRNGTSEADLFLGGSGAYLYGTQAAIGIYKAGGGNMAFDVAGGHMNISGSFGANGAISTNSSIYAATTITAGGDITAISDARLKTSIVTITDALAMVRKLRGVRFDKDGRAGIGVIAQETQEVVPEVVQENDDGMLSVAYGNLVGLLIEAVRELSIQVDRLRARR